MEVDPADTNLDLLPLLKLYEDQRKYPRIELRIPATLVTSEREVVRAFTRNVTPDGLQVHLAGIAPSESARFRALTLAGQIIDSDRVIDEMGVTPTKEIRAPEFSIEILRTPNGLSAIGLIPLAQDRAELLTDLDKAADGAALTDLLETANYPVPEGVQVETPSQTEIVVRGVDKQKVGQVAAELRAYRPPEPYKGKGVRYANEQVLMKEAKKK